MEKRPLPLDQAYTLLEPGPVILLTTAGPKRPNVMTQSWHLMMEFEPPLVGCVVSNRNYSYELLTRNRECVINIPTEDLAEKVVGVGNCSGRRINKFRRFGLTPVAASQVKAPLIEECYASLECRLRDERLNTDYNFFVLEVVAAWVATGRKRPRTLHHQGWGAFRIDGKLIRLPSRMK